MTSGSNCLHLNRPETDDARSIGPAYQTTPAKLQHCLRKNTGIRGWICATSSLGSPVIIVQVRSHSPDSGSFHVFPEPGKGERASVFHGDRERQLRLSRFAPFVESVRWNQAAPFCESLSIGRRFIDGLSSGVDGSASDL